MCIVKRRYRSLGLDEISDGDAFQMTFFYRMSDRDFDLSLTLHILELDDCCNRTDSLQPTYLEFWTLKAVDVESTEWKRVSLPVPRVRRRLESHKRDFICHEGGRRQFPVTSQRGIISVLWIFQNFICLFTASVMG